MPLLLVFVAYLVLYRVVPSQKVTFGDVWPGALVAAMLWTLLRVGYTFYVTQIAHYEDLFGPLAAIITLIVFIYFASVVLLRRRRGRAGQPDRGRQSTAKRDVQPIHARDGLQKVGIGVVRCSTFGPGHGLGARA